MKQIALRVPFPKIWFEDPMGHSSLHWLVLVFASFCCLSNSLLFSTAAAMEYNTTTDPRITFLSFKSMLVDTLGSLTSWDNNTSLHYCTWRGVTCGRRHPLQVIALDLDAIGLSGTISPAISNLTFLMRLSLSDNQLDGSIPEELGRLSRLRFLNLSANQLQGEIPSALSHCSHLESIVLWSNKLSGGIPSNLTRCFKLKYVSLALNKLGGEIPVGIGSLPMLEKLQLGGNKLNGYIPPLSGSNGKLVFVALWNNSLIGGIPSFLANCSTLQLLALQGNSLIGGIPPSFGNTSSLAALDLSNNQLTGGIPLFLIHINNPSPLYIMSLYNNNLAGRIPPSLGNLSSLQILYLDRNDFEGSIPQSLGDIPGLQQLILTSNRLSNTIPPSLYNVSTIEVLSMGNNMLSGTLPSDLGLTLPYLLNLKLYDNKLEGHVPASLANASGLLQIDLCNNSFSGTIPPNLGSLQSLQKLCLSYNRLTAYDWSYLSSLTNCSLLEVLDLTESNMRGALPNFLGNLSTQLKYLLLQNNAISGIIPSEIGNLVSLVTLTMSQNLLSGSIPASIGKLRKLDKLDLSKNKLSGSIPSAIGNLNQLTTLMIGRNKLSGAIPASIQGCTILEYLDICYNVLGGTIPMELFSLSSLTRLLDISNNALIGSIPKEVSNLINLGVLNVSENQLSGDIPSSLGACQLLEQLHMEGNFFQGNIPQSFINLKGVRELDLSRNNLTGRIPNFLGSLGSLHSLNLSFNDFDGEVPNGIGVFSNVSEISVLGNNKLCGDDPKLQLQKCTIDIRGQRSNHHLKIIIPTVTAVIILLLSLFGILYMWRKKKTGVKGQSPTSTLRDERFRKITYADINKATDGFSPINLLGEGSFGSVYKGKIDFEKNFVAVKILKLYQKGASRSFTAECEALKNIRHRNLIRIITACSSIDYRGNDFKALVFEYMPNGSLEKWLHLEVGYEHPQPQKKLTLIQRLNIAIDVASALDYLHHSCEPPVVHCDLKPSNILIDDDMIAHVGDFGLARLLSKSISMASGSSMNSMGIKGTVGYVAPEYGMGGQISTEGDAYSFGVLLLEMLTGKKPTNDMFKDGLNLRRFVEMALPQDLVKILDPQLISLEEGTESEDSNIANENSISRQRNKDCIISLVKIGLLCSTDGPRERMTMRDALTEIHKIKGHFSMARASH